MAFKNRRSLSLLLLLGLAAPLAPASRASAEPLNRVVLRVNDRIATLYDYRDRREEAVQQILRREEDPAERQKQLARIGEQVFKEMYQDLLLQSRADQLGVEISAQQVDAALADTKQRFGITSDQEFQQALQQSGLTLPQFRDQIRNNIRMSQTMRSEIQGKIQIEEEDLRRYYRKNLEDFRQPEQLRLREVVVLEEGGLPAAERQRTAAEIRQAVAGGKALADVIAPYVESKAASNVIDLGWVSPGDLDPALETASWKLPVDAVSEPVAGRGGLHLLQVVERRESRIPPFQEVAEAIRRREGERLFREESIKYMDDLEKRSLVVANPPQEAANFRRLLDTPAAAASGGPAEGLAATDGPVSEGAPGAPGAAEPPPASPATSAPQQPPGTLPEAKPVTDTPPSPPPAR